MRKQILCEAKFSFSLEVTGPFLIKSGQESLSYANMSPVLSFAYRDESEPQPYIPGTSIKGVFRSHIERIIRTIARKNPAVCLPYLQRSQSNDPERSCGKKLEGVKSTSERYRQSCAACRLFGSLVFRGRTAFSDAYSPDPSAIKRELRDGVAIDRKTGGTVAGAKYDFEVLTAGEFHTSVKIENFELWQLAFFVLTLQDLQEGRITMGMGGSRGLGNIRAKNIKVEVGYPFHLDPGNLIGLYSLSLKKNSDLVEEYGLLPEPKDNSNPLQNSDPTPFGLWNFYELSLQELTPWTRKVLELFRNSYM